jgi:hypothetical protein
MKEFKEHVIGWVSRGLYLIWRYDVTVHRFLIGFSKFGYGPKPKKVAHAAGSTKQSFRDR